MACFLRLLIVLLMILTKCLSSLDALVGGGSNDNGVVSAVVRVNICRTYKENVNSNQTIWSFFEDSDDFSVHLISEPLSCNNAIKSVFQRGKVINETNSSASFTRQGYFHDGTSYYKPENYCLSSASDEKVEVQLCSPKCVPNNICVPKCCGADEVLVYWKFKCRKLARNETHWEPQVFDEDENEIYSEKSNLYLQKYPCDVDQLTRFPFSDVRTPNKDGFEEREAVRFKNGKPEFFSVDREWKEIKGVYCLDGFVNMGNSDRAYNGSKSGYQVLLLCPSQEMLRPTQFNAPRAITYTIVLFLSSIFLLLAVITHLTLLNKQNLRGLTVLSHLVSMLFSYISLGMAHFLSVYPEYRGGYQRAPFCMAVAISAHYFVVSSFTWLAILNFHMWSSFRGIQVARNSKGLERLIMYSFLGWGLPFLAIGAFVTVNETFIIDRFSEVLIPNYASSCCCFLAVKSRGEYLYLPIAILLVVTAVFISLTLITLFYGKRRQIKLRKELSDESRKSALVQPNFTIKMFFKLFCVMGIAWFEELLSWQYSPEIKPIWLFILDCASSLLSGIGPFFIFCINRRVLDQLANKLNCIRSLKNFLENTGVIRKQSIQNGKCNT